MVVRRSLGALRLLGMTGKETIPGTIRMRGDLLGTVLVLAGRPAASSDHKMHCFISRRREITPASWIFLFPIEPAALGFNGAPR